MENPKDVIPCWYVSEKEKAHAIREKKPFYERNETTSMYFRITSRIDSYFIEGYLGRIPEELTFHESINYTLTYFKEYFEKRKRIYLTFDKVALYQVVEIFQEKPFRFILKRIDNLKAFIKNQTFMIMPFHNEDLDNFYFSHIKPFLKDRLGIEIYRADDFRDNDIIVQTIYTLIEESEFIIADTTYDNKNAFYELGFASALSKEIITIQNKKTEQKLFFDRAHIRTILYDADDLGTFHFDLESTIKSIRSRQ